MVLASHQSLFLKTFAVCSISGCQMQSQQESMSPVRTSYTQSTNLSSCCFKTFSRGETKCFLVALVWFKFYFISFIYL